VNGIEGAVSSSRNGNFDLKIFFKDFSTGEMESVTLRFIHEEPLQKWLQELERLLDRKRRRSAPASSDRRRRNTETASRPKTSTQSPDSAKTLEQQLISSQENNRSAQNDLRIRVPHVAAHISPLASPMLQKGSSLTENLSLTPASRKTSDSLANRQSGNDAAQLSKSQENPIGALDKFLNDFETALKDGYFEDEEGLPEPIVTPPPPLPRARSSQTSLKVKVRYDEEIFLVLIAPNTTMKELLERIRAKVGQKFEKVRYQDEDGDFITIRSDEDLELAIKHATKNATYLNIFVL
jgi:hypothetical protein